MKPLLAFLADGYLRAYIQLLKISRYFGQVCQAMPALENQDYPATLRIDGCLSNGLKTHSEGLESDSDEIDTDMMQTARFHLTPNLLASAQPRPGAFNDPHGLGRIQDARAIDSP